MNSKRFITLNNLIQKPMPEIKTQLFPIIHSHFKTHEISKVSMNTKTIAQNHSDKKLKHFCEFEKKPESAPMWMASTFEAEITINVTRR